MTMIRTFLLLFALAHTLYGERLDVSVSGRNAILINAQTGAVLFEKEADTPTFPASTTKIATSLYVLEHYDDQLDEVAEVKKEAVASITPQAKRESNYRSPSHWLETDGSTMGLKLGEKLRVRDLLYGAMLVSGNDACNALAFHCLGSMSQFMESVNAFIAQMGCTQTRFENPHGLHHPSHVTTARDLAQMAAYGLKNPLFREIVGSVTYPLPRSNLQEERVLKQTNLLMRPGNYYDSRVIGIKTGTTGAAGSCLVSAAQEGDRELVAVVLGCKNRDSVLQDTKRLFRAAFDQPRLRRTLLPPGKTQLIKKVKGGGGKLKTTLPNGLAYEFYDAEDEPVKATVSWKLPSLPIKEGTIVGSVNVINDRGVVLKEEPLYAAATLRRSIWPLFFLIPLFGLVIFFLAKRARRL